MSSFLEKVAMVTLSPVLVPIATVMVIKEEFFNDKYENETYNNRYESEEEAKEMPRAERNERIQIDIKKYKEQQEKRLKVKYDVDIEFIGKNQINCVNGIFYAGFLSEQKDTVKMIEKNDSDGVDIIKNLEDEVDDIIRLIGELEVMKYESIS